MDASPNTHRPLTKKQLQILDYLYQFRFLTTFHLATALGTPHKGKVGERLTLLMTQGYIGRHYEKSYHLSGRHATEPNGCMFIRYYNMHELKHIYIAILQKL